MMASLRILFAVHDWGLGHATRSLPLIRGLLDKGHQVTVLSNGRALTLLRQELSDRADYLAFPDIPKPLGRTAFGFYVRMAFDMPEVLLRFRRERALTARLVAERGFDRVVSDSRFGVVSRVVPSFYLFHSLRQIMPAPLRMFRGFVERNQRRMLADARRILVPDARVDGLAGALCHDLDLDWTDRVRYLGILSSVAAETVPEDVDVFVSISGAEPGRTQLEEKVLAQVGGLDGHVEVALGRPDVPYRRFTHDGATVHTYLDRRAQAHMLNRAKLVVTRSGYTTLMELAELGKRALLVPTVGQSEQAYLASYHHLQGHALARTQASLDLVRDVPEARRTAGLPRSTGTGGSVHRFLDAVAA